MSKNGITEQVEDALTYPILTQQVETQPSTDTQTVSISGGASIDSIAQGTIRRVLGWRYRASDTKGFTAALTKTFTLKQVEGHVEWDWKPQNYMVQADLGEVTGAQASIYSRAKVALDQIIPLLDALTPLRVDADPEDCEAIRSIIRNELKDQLVPEFGQAGGPRVQLVDQVFALLLGPEPVTQDPEKVAGQFGEMRNLFGFDRTLVTSITEEVDLTNFLIVIDYVNSLYATWKAQAKFLGRQPGTEPFLGTQLVLLSQALEVVAESVQMAYDAMDSVFFRSAERQTTLLSLNGEAPITVAELLNWVDQATVEGLQMLQDGGKFGVVVLQSTVSRLYDLVNLAWIKSKSGSNNPIRGFHTARSQRALDEIRINLRAVRDLAGEINAPDGQPTLRPTVTSVSPDKGPPAATPLTISGANLSGASQVVLVGQNPPQFVSGTYIKKIGDSQLTANFDLSNSQPGELDLVLLTVDGLRVEFERAFTVQAPAPKITSVAQRITEQSDELLLEVAGQYFQPRAIVTLTSVAGNVQYTGDVQSLTANLIVALFSLSLIRPANWHLVVTNPDGQSTPPINFTVILPPPVIESFVPRFAENNSTLDLTVRGQYFQPTAQVSLESDENLILSKQTTVQSAETIESSFDLANPKPAPAGLYYVVVTNPDGQQAWSNDQVEIVDSTVGQMLIKPAPEIGTVHPRVDAKAGRLNLRVEGKNLQAGMIVTLTDQDYAVKADVVNDTTLFAEFDLSPVLNGPWTLLAQNPDGQKSNIIGFQIVFPPPVVQSFVPTSSIEHNDLHLTVRGQYFRSPATVQLQGQSGVLVASQPATVVSSEIVQADFSGTALAEGDYYVIVSNPDGQLDWSLQVLEIEAYAGLRKHPTPKRSRRRPAGKAARAPIRRKPGQKPTKP
jgi:hypothetical protein